MACREAEADAAQNAADRVSEARAKGIAVARKQAEQTRTAILKLIRKHGPIIRDDLELKAGVTRETLRRHLLMLEATKKITKRVSGQGGRLFFQGVK